MCCYFVCALNATTGSFISNTTDRTEVSNHTNKKEEEKRQETVKETVGIDYEFTNFTNHLSEKYQSIFNALKDKAVENKTKEEIDFLARNYDNKFKEIVNKTRNQIINTKSGRRNAILHTFDSATVILDNVVNHLQDNLVGNSNEDEISAGLVKEEAAKFVEREKEFLCEKFTICRESESFADFMLEILATTSKLNHKKLKTMINSLKEVAKKTGTVTLRDPTTKTMYIAAMERTDNPYWLKIVFTTMKNIIEHKNKPLSPLGPDPDGQIVAKTHAFIEALDAMDKVSPPTNENKKLWKDIERSVKAWAEEKRKESEIKDIMQKLMDHLYKGVKSFYAGEEGVAKLESLVNIFMQ